MTDSFDDQTLREQAEEILRYIESDPDQTLVPDGRVNLLKRTLEKPEPPETALLGLATTAEMLEELLARATIGGYANYRTVGGEEIAAVVPSTA